MAGALADQTIGIIGLGLMGKPMARNLAKAGATLVVYNRSKAAVEELAKEGMRPATSAREVAANAPVVIMMLTDTPAVDAVLHGSDGVIAGIKPAALVIDMGTTAVASTRDFAAEVRAKAADYVDAPVSGGQVAAVAGTLTIMAGGSEAGFACAKPLFEAMGRTITHVGEVGAGQVAKTANQIIVALTIGAVAEALSIAKAAGVDPAKVRQAIRGGFAESRILELHGQRMIDKTFAPGGRARVQRKDVIQALDLARQCGIEMPALAQNLTLWDRLIEAGDGDLDHSALIRVYDRG